MAYKEVVQHYRRSFKFLKEWKDTKEGFRAKEVAAGAKIACFVTPGDAFQFHHYRWQPTTCKRDLLSHHSVHATARVAGNEGESGCQP